MKFAFFDGDNIGNILELLFLQNKEEEAFEISNKIKIAFNEIESFIKKDDSITILMNGGDDLIIKLRDKNALNKAEQIRKIFFDNSSLSLSCGIGNTVRESLENLRIAKLTGKNNIKY